jgi:hypothetical protein
MARSEPSESASLDAWLARIRTELGPNAALELTAREVTALLDLARVAAHTSERIAAPLTTFLVGIAIGEPSGDERATRIEELTASLSGDGW